jgi:chromosome segregation ATPase
MEEISISKIHLLVVGVIFLILLGGNIFFIKKSKDLEREITQTKDLLSKAREDIKRSESEKESVKEELATLQSDIVGYLTSNTQLQQENEKLKEELDQLKQELSAKEEELARFKEDIKKKEEDLKKKTEEIFSLEKSTQKEGEEKKRYAKEIEELNRRIQNLEVTLNEERALYHYNLGVAYSQAGLYDQAMIAYKRSLEFKEANPEAHYNLALLYEKITKDLQRAAFHYQRYLELNPNAEDREEVEALIKDFISP